MSTHPRFTNKRALITGSTRGLGRTTTEWLAREGADVYVTGRDQADVDRAIADLRGHGGQVWGSVADLEDIGQAHALATRALAEAGPFDILINNAGFSRPQPFLEVTDADWNAELTVNLHVPFVLSQHISRAMIEHDIRGRIVNISTIGVFAAHMKQMVYDIAKAGVQAMTRNMAIELGPHGITANCIAPGAVPDRPGYELDITNETLQTWQSRIPMRRLGSADDIANAVCFFCQNESSWITGQTLLVDGGHISYLRED